MSTVFVQPELNLQLRRIQLVQKLLQLEPRISDNDISHCIWTAIADMRMKLIDAIERKCVGGTHVIARMRKKGMIPENISEHLDVVFDHINDTFVPVVSRMFQAMHDVAITIDTALLGSELSLHGYSVGCGEDDGCAGLRTAERSCAHDTVSSTGGDYSEFEDDAGEEEEEECVPDSVSRVRDMWERMCATQQTLLLKEWQRGHYFACSQD